MLKLLYVIFAILVLLLIVQIGIFIEKKGFNNGWCPNCGTRLRFFDTDSQGGRGYCCDNCSYHTWVSYKRVDKEYLRGGGIND